MTRAKKATQGAVAPARGPKGGVAKARSRERALLAVRAALDKKALEPVLLEVGDLASYTDYVLVVSGTSDRHVQALADAVRDALKEDGAHLLGVEGVSRGQWTLVDFGDVIIHVFHHPVREFYDLESLWIDAPRVALDLPAEAKVPAGHYY